MFRKAAHNNESGVALLFALGILSLLLVLGLAFASNALLAQKVAYNNSSRSQAKLLAQSAISRIAIAMMYYQYQADAKGIIPVNYSAIYSDGADGIDEDGNVFADGLYSTDDSLLTPPTSSVSASFEANSNTYKLPKWAFIFDKPKGEDDRKIIGRIAYQQVIDDEKGISKINLDNVLHGIYSQETNPRIPWNNRWGKSINELNLGSSTPFKEWQETLAPESASDLDISSLADFFNAYSDPSEPFFDYTNVNSDGYKNKNFVERWFTGGKTKAEPEFYRYDISSTEYKSLHRFNLGDLTDCYLEDDIWYDRFRKDTSLTINKNTDTFLTQLLAADSKEFNLTEDLTPPDTGIPFLKQIANEPGTFSTLEARRKQIAANLNDYCDPDSKPTSDVDATNWSVEEGATEPTFTGNERTPYIYELGYKLEIYHQADGATKTKGFEVDVTNKELGFQLALFPAVKLAQIYENIPDDFQKFIFKNSVKEISLKGKIIEATYNGIKYKYKNAEGNEVEASSPASGTIEVADKEIKFEPKWNITPSTGTGELLLNKPNDAHNNISFDLSLNGYPFGEAKDSNNWHGEKYQTDVAGLFDKEILIKVVTSTTSLDPKDIVSVSGPTSVEITKVNVSEVTVKRGALLLQGQLKDTSSPFGVDFVRAPQKEENSLKFKTTGSALSLSEAEAFTFLLGGIRGMDPRQNLNEDDWHVSARATAGTSQWSAVMDVSTGTPVTGKANVSPDPALDPPFDPGMATDTSKYDQEKKVANNGPAWGDDTNHLSTAYIRNAPMQSLWELGVIHRGAAWQTLNLKAAGAPGGGGSISPSDMKQLGNVWDTTPGTTYAAGDGGILEQVKLTEETYCFGKVNINMLAKRPDETIPGESPRFYDSQMAEALFYKIRYGQEIRNFETNTTSGTEISPTSNLVPALTSDMNRPFASRTQFLDWKYSTGSLSNAFGLVDMTSASDAQQEEIVGKTINLLKAEPSASNVIQFIVVAQTIRDLNGMVTRVRPDDNTVITKNCAYGQFDVARYIDKDDSKLTITSDASGKLSNDGSDPSTPDSTQSPDDFIYFDEITGEVKMLVTLEKVSEVTGQLIVTSIEYID